MAQSDEAWAPAPDPAGSEEEYSESAEAEELSEEGEHSQAGEIDATASFGTENCADKEQPLDPDGSGLADLVGGGDLLQADGEDINISTFEEIRLEDGWVDSVHESWRLFIENSTSREAAGEAIYTALFDSAPSLQGLFRTPRAVQAMRFMDGLNNFVANFSDPPALKTVVETLGFGHLALDVTVPRAIIFRDAIIDLMHVDLGERFTTIAMMGWRALLNYVGGAIIYVKSNYSERLMILERSWTAANDRTANSTKFATTSSSHPSEEAVSASNRLNTKGKSSASNSLSSNGSRKGLAQQIPTTFAEMFRFNASVMGFGGEAWMNEVIQCFDNMVKNVANSGRFAEECDVLVLRISKVSNVADVNLASFKACMLASLRSLLPKDWSTAHEVAWSWMWENAERMLASILGHPRRWEVALAKFLAELDETTAFEFRAAVYTKFFHLCPSGQDYFKQSNTYLHLIATKVMNMTLDMYRDPVRMIDDISALGLRHVGYGIPTEFFAPFATACIDVLSTFSTENAVIESFRWSLGLIARSLVRTILEGSTVVMRAINTNSRRSMHKAAMCAPRGERVSWMLMVQVGTQNISPLAWAIETGSLEAAAAMIHDLLAIRADRDRYYYGAEEMFMRHPDLVKKLIEHAPALLSDLFEGLIWRSRLTARGLRKVNYYIKHLLIDPDGNYHKTLAWLVKFKDPHIVCHPVLEVLADLVWNRVALKLFVFRKSWFILTLVLFSVSQSILQHLHEGEFDENGYERTTTSERIVVLCFRATIYIFSFGHMIAHHLKRSRAALRKQDLVTLVRPVRVPAYITEWQEITSLLLVIMLFLMLLTEPILHCLTDSHGVLFVEDCDSSKGLLFPYSCFSMIAMLLYFMLLVDLAVLSNAVTAYVLVCGRMLAELSLFLFLGLAIIVSFSSSLSCLHQPVMMFHGIPSGGLVLFEIFMGMFSKRSFEDLHEESIVLLSIFLFIIVTIVFLANMFVAQLCCAYAAIYNDVVGFARLKRIGIITETMPVVSSKRWGSFVASLKFDKRIDFNEGDVGLAGGIAVTEPASKNPTAVDRIKRFGGSTSPTAPWREEDLPASESDRLAHLEKNLHNCLSRLTKVSSKQRWAGRSSSLSGSSGGGTSGFTSGLQSGLETDDAGA